MRTQADDWYSMGRCTDCGLPLEDVLLGQGYERCGECEERLERVWDLQAEARARGDWYGQGA